MTLRGLTLRNAGAEAIRLAGGVGRNTGIHLERNRILGNGSCPGGIVVEAENRDMLIVNNAIYGNAGNGVTFAPGHSGPHYVISNTIHGNSQNGVSFDSPQQV